METMAGLRRGRLLAALYLLFRLQLLNCKGYSYLTCLIPVVIVFVMKFV